MSAWRPIEEAFRNPDVTGNQRTLFVMRFGKEQYPSFNCVYYDPMYPGAGDTHCWVFAEGHTAYHRDWPTHWMFADDAAPTPEILTRERRNMSDTLKLRQEAGACVERKMIDFLVQFDPARTLTIGDAKIIANAARMFAFDEFSVVELESRSR